MQKFVIIFALFALGACNIHTSAPRTRVDLPGGVTVTNGGSTGKHCPPGHAKKGWC